MLQNTLTARAYRYACVFSGHPQMERAKNVQYYDDLTSEGVELGNFEQKVNEIVLTNKTAPPNLRRVVVGHFRDKFRLLVLEDFPNETIEVFKKIADASWKVFSKIWNPPKQAFFLSEVTLRYSASAEGGDAKKFLLQNCIKIPNDSLERSLGRKIDGIGLRLVSPILVSSNSESPLTNADFNLNIETLLDDPSRLYIELTTKWPSTPLPTARGPLDNMPGLPTFLNPECENPSWYLEQAENFVENQVVNLLIQSKENRE